MSDEPASPLDIARFNLDAYTASVELQVKKMMAFADFNVRMMDAAQKQVEVLRDQTRLRILQEAFRDYSRARNAALKRARDLHDKMERFNRATLRVAHLVQGETAAAALVDYGWRGFWFLVSQAPVNTVVQLGSIVAIPSDLRGQCFYNPSRPEEAVADPPRNIPRALLLMDWARDRNVVPRLSSSTMQRLVQLLEILGKGAEDALIRSQQEYAAAMGEVTRVRERTWEALVVEDEQPKE